MKKKYIFPIIIILVIGLMFFLRQIYPRIPEKSVNNNSQNKTDNRNIFIRQGKIKKYENKEIYISSLVGDPVQLLEKKETIDEKYTVNDKTEFFEDTQGNKRIGDEFLKSDEEVLIYYYTDNNNHIANKVFWIKQAAQLPPPEASGQQKVDFYGSIDSLSETKLILCSYDNKTSIAEPPLDNKCAMKYEFNLTPAVKIIKKTKKLSDEFYREQKEANQKNTDQKEVALSWYREENIKIFDLKKDDYIHIVASADKTGNIMNSELIEFYN